LESLQNFRQILALAQTGNFRSAAKQLGISHSALSQNLAKLEEHYGVPLFDRGRHGTVPNTFGRRVLDVARSVVAEVEQVSREVHLMRNLEEGRLIVGASPAIIEGVVGVVLAIFLQDYPNVQFIVRPQAIETFEDDLRAHKIDIYIGMTPRQDRPELRYEATHNVPPVVVCRKRHPILKDPGDALSQIHNYPIVGPEAPDWVMTDAWRSLINEENGYQIPDKPFLQTNNVSLIKQVLLVSNAVALLSRWSVSKELASGAFVELARPAASTNPGAIVTLEGHPISPITRHFLDAVKNIVAIDRPQTG